VPIRLVILEDNLLVREGLRQLLSMQDDLEVAAACADLGAASEAIAHTHPDVVVTDIRLPPRNADEGIVLADSLRSTHPPVGVVVVSQHADPSYAMALFEQGSAGRAYLLKERIHHVEELVDAILAVHRGESRVDAHVVEALVRSAGSAERSPLTELTPRELDVLGLMARGKNNAAIAAELFLTEHSVEKYVSSILAKLGIASDPAAHRRVKAVLVYLAAAGLTGADPSVPAPMR
jgi:DNA-binding NarL/FixJ family response regulator